MEHDMESIHELHAYLCIYNKYSKTGDSYSKLVLSSEVQTWLLFVTCLEISMGWLRGGLTDTKIPRGLIVVYMQALTYGQEFFDKEDNQLKTQISQVMEALMTMPTILHLLPHQMFSLLLTFWESLSTMECYTILSSWSILSTDGSHILWDIVLVLHPWY